MTTRVKLLFVLGTRPEAIKLAPVILAARARSGIEVVVCNTGQHQAMANEMLQVFGIVPDIKLNIMKPGQTLTDITVNILQSLEKPVRDLAPDWVVVQGDTTTSFAAALAGFYQRIPVAHIEAGLRTGNMYSPWPEEINRRMNAVLATLHFAPTEQGRDNLVGEGIDADRIIVTGNTGIDALKHVVRRLEADPELNVAARRRLVSHGLNFLMQAPGEGRIVIVTAHRRENFGTGIPSICRALVRLARQFADVAFVFPVHPNPEVTTPVDRIIRPAGQANIFAVQPLDYLSFAYLLESAAVIVTDSGGIQEEAAALGRNLVVLRDITERVELVGLPGVHVVGTDEDRIVDAVGSILADPNASVPVASAIYGQGEAASQIVDRLTDRR